MIFVFINCSLFPFINWIIAGKKIYETRNRNTLKPLIGKTVYLVETGKHNKPVVRCRCNIANYFTIDNINDYELYRPGAMIALNSVFDFIPGKKKVFYKLERVEFIKPFELPVNIVRHCRTWAETIK